MKRTLVFLILAVCGATLPAQLPITSGTGARNPLLENTTDDLRAAITLYSYTWKDATPGAETIQFKSDGIATVKNERFRWHVINSQEIDLIKAGEEAGGPRIHLKFSKDYATYSGVDADGVHTLGGSRLSPDRQAAASPSPGAAIKPNTNTTADLNKNLIGNDYSWEREGTSYEHIKFNADGTGRHIDSIKPDWEFRWRATSAQEIEITVDDDQFNVKGKAILKFSDDYSTYTGTDLDGVRPVHGSREAEGTAGASPSPAPATAAHATHPAKPNPFSTNTTEDLKKAIVAHGYTWEHEGTSNEFIKFNADGTGRHGKNDPDWAFHWRVKSPQEVEIYLESDSQNAATIKFNDDYTTYTGTDFYGTRTIKGRQIIPQTP
ncbi:MAG TPA: hypothetical protein VG733_10435 [Chthoniobacteraceae bacterium]|nr:hypothetical protein [Chthoniobacteraceae bacterium]